MSGNDEGGSAAASCEMTPIWIRRGFGSSGFATWISSTPAAYSALIELSSVPCGRPIVRVNEPNRRSWR